MIYQLYRQTPEMLGIQGSAEEREFEVSSYENGRIVSIEVSLGREVQRNQVLARLDKSMLEQEIKVAEAELRELESQVPAKYRLLKQNAEESDRPFQSDMEKAAEDLENARAYCKRIQAELAGTQKEFNRQQDLVQRRMTTADRMHVLQLQLAAIQQENDSCPSQIKILEAKDQAARKRFNEWRVSQEGNSGQNTHQEQLLPIQLRSQWQKEKIRLLKMRMENLVLRSPVDGYIASIKAASGNVVTAGDPLIVVVQSRPQQIIAYSDENRLCSLVPGETVVLRPRNKATPPMQGRVVSVSPTVTQLPPRFWLMRQRPLWGRRIFIQADSSRDLIPGERFDIISGTKTDPINLAAESAHESSTGKAPDAMPQTRKLP